VRLTYTKERGAGWARAATYAVGFVVLLWAIEFVDVVLGNRLDDEGVRPRDDEGLVGILFAPLLHAGWDHLIANTLPLLVLGFLVFFSGIGRAVAATAVIWVVGGLGTWLIAPERTVHIGASVIVFGWLTYLILRGIFARSEGQIAMGAVILVLYGGALLGVLPGQPGVSWQGHLFGAIGGGLAAWWLAPDRRSRAPV
jgi:membrane associated rhomboid family serine protease